MPKYLAIICLFFTLLKANTVYSQTTLHIHLLQQQNSIKQDTLARQVDLIDVIRKIRGRKNFGAQRNDSITGRPLYSFIPAVGYTLSSGFAISVSGNIQFRTDSSSRISTITASVALSSKKQFTVPIVSTIWLKNNNFLLVGDYRFYKYRQSTYGLGSGSPKENEDPMRFDYLRFYETVYKQLSGDLYIGAGYIIDDHYHISEEGTKSGVRSDYSYYGARLHNISSGFTINGLYDGRDNQVNPSSGFYGAIQYRDNFRALGSSNNWKSLIVDFRRYINFPKGSGNTIALWSYNWVVLHGKPPYLDLPSTSWDPYSSTGRGYIQGRFRGAQMIYAEGAYRFRLTANGLIGAVLFANAQTFSAQPGTRPQQIQPGFGPGLRVKLNKVSKTNICIDYGFGNNGSRGLFINVGELF